MKSLACALAFFGLAALTAAGQQANTVNSSRSNIKNNLPVVSNRKVWCTFSASGRPTACTESYVAVLNKALASKSAEKGASKSNGIKSIALAKDGSLLCVTSTGTGPCTAAHLPELKQADGRVNSEFANVTETPAARK